MIFPSENLYELFRRVDKKTEGIIIPNGIHLDKFSPLKEKHKEILVVTRMFERKGVQYILKALEGMEHDYKINIVGEGPYLEALKRLAIESKLDVNFLGFIDNHSDQLKKLYEESSIFIFASESENFPIVLLEAMVARLAIITTRNTGCAEVVGDTALLVDSKDSNAIRNALIELINNPQLAEALRQSARKRVEELFGWQSVANQYAKVYKSFISK
jgi:glycosyltransferase involved in cell wall biosynthesis